MQIGYTSDLHLEFSSVRLENTAKADVLVLAGDVLVAHDLVSLNDLCLDRKFGYERSLAYLKTQFKHVLAVAGNHEYWGSKLNGTHEILENFYADLGITYLQNKAVVIDGVKFLGTTLWTDCGKGDPLALHQVEYFMNDYRKITYDNKEHNQYRKLQARDTVWQFRRAVEFLKGELKEEMPSVVITHHAPSFQSTDPQYGGQADVAYASDLSELILDHPHIHSWIHGHVHKPTTYFVGPTVVRCNPRGYVCHGHTESFEYTGIKYFDTKDY